jgi:hypothetical protein
MGLNMYNNQFAIYHTDLGVGDINTAHVATFSMPIHVLHISKV